MNDSRTSTEGDIENITRVILPNRKKGEIFGIGVLPFPWDFLVVIIVAVGFYIWSVKSGFKTEEITEMIASGTQYVEEQSEASGGK